MRTIAHTLNAIHLLQIQGHLQKASVGICWLVGDEHRFTLAHDMPHWVKYSGHGAFPVPSPVFDMSHEEAYLHASHYKTLWRTNHWDRSSYANDRIELLDWLRTVHPCTEPQHDLAAYILSERVR